MGFKTLHEHCYEEKSIMIFLSILFLNILELNIHQFIKWHNKKLTWRTSLKYWNKKNIQLIHSHCRTFQKLNKSWYLSVHLDQLKLDIIVYF